MMRSALPHHYFFLPGAMRMPPSSSAYFAQQISEGSVCANVSRDPPVATNVTSHGFTTSQASTAFSNPTRKEQIKPTEQAFLKQGSQWKKNKTELLWVHSRNTTVHKSTASLSNYPKGFGKCPEGMIWLSTPVGRNKLHKVHFFQ